MLLHHAFQVTLILVAFGSSWGFFVPDLLRGTVTKGAASRIATADQHDTTPRPLRRKSEGLANLHPLLEYPVLLPFEKAQSKFSPWGHTEQQEEEEPELIWTPFLGSIVTPEPRTPPPVDQDHRHNSNFTLNVGHAIDVLRIDVPLCFDKQPDMSIYTEDVRLRDDFRVYSTGKFMYSMVFFTLRLARGFMPVPPTVDVIAVRWCEARQCIYARFQIRIDTLSGDPVYFDAVSLYRVNEQGIIFEHILEKVIRNDVMQRQAVASLAEMLVAAPLGGRTVGEKSLGGC